MSPLFWFLFQAGLVALPLLLLARFARAYPSRRCLWAFAIPSLLAIGPPTLATIVAGALLASRAWTGAETRTVGAWMEVWSQREFWAVVIALDVVAATLAFFDLLTLPQRNEFSIERQAAKVASLKIKHPVTLFIDYRGDRAQRVRVVDVVDPALAPSPEEFDVVVAPRSRNVVHYEIKSTRRGEFLLPDVHVVASSRFGWWNRTLKYPVETVIHVYPDLQQVSQYAIMARLNRLSMLGVRKSRRVGGDNEFERLRDYTTDDSYKHLDWRATARRSRLTVRDYQSDQSQRIVFLLDCGRMMTNTAAGLSLLDHALNAVLMLSYVALSHGDQVGLLTFSDEVHGFISPSSGKRTINRLLAESFDRFPRRVESRYDKAFTYLGRHCRKRSLVVLATNVVDEVNGVMVKEYLSTLVGKHLPLGVLLRDRRLFDLADAPLDSRTALFRAGAAADILLWRKQVLTDLHAQGVRALDVFPEDLTAPLINEYLTIKARKLL